MGGAGGRPCYCATTGVADGPMLCSRRRHGRDRLAGAELKLAAPAGDLRMGGGVRACVVGLA